MTTATLGGRFDPDEGAIYFLAGNQYDRYAQFHPYVLASSETYASKAVAELERLQRALAGGAKVLLDSGVFSLVTAHARRHGLGDKSEGLSRLFALPPEQLDGFPACWAAHLELCRRFGDDLWGAIEFDLGGPTHKRRLRTMCEDQGVNVIPVWHPLTDPPEYLDEIASTYDRIAVGGIARASDDTRRRVLIALSERRAEWPELKWIHLLGYTPDYGLCSYPTGCDSSDSSSWVYAIRYGAPSAPGPRAMLAHFSRLDHDYSYDLGAGDEGEGLEQAVVFLSTGAAFLQHGWRRVVDDLTALQA